MFSPGQIIELTRTKEISEDVTLREGTTGMYVRTIEDGLLAIDFGPYGSAYCNTDEVSGVGSIELEEDSEEDSDSSEHSPELIAAIEAARNDLVGEVTETTKKKNGIDIEADIKRNMQKYMRG